MKKLRTTFDMLAYIYKDIYRWNKSILIIMVLYTITKAISPFVWIYAPKFMIDELLSDGDMTYIIQLLLIAFLLSGITNYTVEYCIGALRMKMNAIRYRYIHQLSDKSLTMDYHFTEDTKTLDELRSVSRTVSNPWRGIGGIITVSFKQVGALIGLVGYIAIIGSFNLIVLLVLIITVILSYIISNKVNFYERSKRDELSKFERRSHYATNTMANFLFGKDIRTYNLKNLLIHKKKESDNGIISTSKDIEHYRLKGFILDSFLYLLREGLIYAYLIFAVMNETIGLGDFVMYSVAVTGFATWLDEILKDFSFIIVQSQYVNDYKDFVDGKSSNKNYKDPVPDFSGYDIEFDNISFKYPNSDRYIFKNFSLSIKDGERLALVGINGAGKTTLVKLLTGLYEPTEGRILINGNDISTYKRDEFWKLFSVVFQDVHVYAFGVDENIAFTSDHINDSKVTEALSHAGLLSKVESLKEKQKTVMLKIMDKEGVEFSGGENQKLAMARSLYKEGKILIMDEPTSALDPLAEYDLYHRFDEMIDNRSAIYISHRLSSTRFCDVIAYIEDGTLIEYGSHEQLLNANGAYANLFNIQARYYKEHGEEAIYE